MIVIKNVFGGSKVYIKNVFANAENIVVVYNGGEPIEISGGGGGSGDVTGPASATDNAVARFNGTTGKIIQNSGVTIDDSGNITATNLSGTNTGDQDLSGYYTEGEVDTLLSGKANTSHTHIIGDVTGLQTALDGKASISHTHIIADVTGLQTALDGKAATSHSHIIGDVTGLQTALDGKQATLVSGTNIKTLFGNSLLGSGNLGFTQDPEVRLIRELSSKVYISQNYSINSTNNANVITLSDGTAQYVAIYIPYDVTITGVSWLQRVSGIYTAADYNGIGLFSYSSGTLTLVASTTDDGDIWKGTANSANSRDFSATYNAAQGVYFVCFLYNQSAQTTAPTIGAKPTIHTGYNSLFNNSAVLFGQKTVTTALPATIASSSLTTLQQGPWCALY